MKKNLECDCDVIHGENVESAKKLMPSEDELFDLSEFFKVLGDSTRVRIVSALDASPLCVCDLAALLNMTKSAISHQLRSLRDANLVMAKREGKNVFYSLADEHICDIFETGLAHIREEREEREEEE